jgi:hypothetical protein
MNAKSTIVKRLKEAATKASARVAAAKDDLKAVKSRLKQARKAFKAEKKAAKQLRRKLKEAVAATLVRRRRPSPSPKTKAPLAKAQAKRKSAARRRPKPRTKARTKPAPDTMRSAAEVAKSVIERLHAPPPLLPPAPLIAPSVPGDSGSTVPSPGKP